MSTQTIPPEINAAIQAYANAMLFHEQVSETRAALIVAVEKYGQARYDDGRHDEYRRHVRVPAGFACP